MIDVIYQAEGFTGMFYVEIFRYYSAFLVNEREVFLLSCSLQTNVNKSQNMKMQDAQVHRTPKFIRLNCTSGIHNFFVTLFLLFTTFVICSSFCLCTLFVYCVINIDPGQTAPLGAVWSGFIMFASVVAFLDCIWIYAWVKVFRVNPEFRILRLTFHRKCWIKEIIIAFLTSFQII